MPEATETAAGGLEMRAVKSRMAQMTEAKLAKMLPAARGPQSEMVNL